MTYFVIVTSENPVKRAGVKKAFEDTATYAEFSFNRANSGVSKQPFSLEEMMDGARNRAKSTFDDYRRAIAQEFFVPDKEILTVGVESGVYQVKDKYFDSCHVAIHDGSSFYEGVSVAFEVPPQVIEHVKKNNLELGNFFDGHAGGVIGVLTGGQVNRLDQIVQATTLALHLYKNASYRYATPGQSLPAQYRQPDQS